MVQCSWICDSLRFPEASSQPCRDWLIAKAGGYLMHRRSVILAVLVISAAVAGCSATPPTTQPTRIEDLLCADGIAVVFAWEDRNGDGLYGPGEPPLANVDISVSGQQGVTEADGTWASDFVVGDCGFPDQVRASMDEQCRSLPISASPPVGYAPTTETTVYGCDVRFGFMSVYTSSPSIVPTGTVLVTATVPVTP
jgi:hypothetical protein